MPNIAAYLRVSTEEQSTDHQRASIVGYALQLGLKESDILFYADDGVSGSHEKLKKRPAFQKLLKDIVQGKVNKVLVFETSRASRDFFDYLDFLRLCRDNNCKLDVVGKGEVSFERSEDILMASIAAFLGQAERERISVRTKSGLAKARAEGKVLGAPEGNRNRRGKLKEYEPSLVSRVKKLAKAGMSSRKIADFLANGSPDEAISHVTVQRILKRY